MNKLFRFTMILSAVLLFFSAGCKKDNSTPPLTKTDHLISGPWKFDKATASGIDISAQIPACFKDNTITFVIGGNGAINEGPIVCVPPSSATFTWSFQNSETQINLSTPLISGGSGVFTVVTLNEVTLELSQNMTIPPATTPVPVVITFKH